MYNYKYKDFNFEIFIIYIIIIKLSIAAINNHIKYGICRYPANLFLDRKSLIIIITNKIKNKIQINANVSNLNLKNTNDHSKLNVN